MEAGWSDAAPVDVKDFTTLDGSGDCGCSVGEEDGGGVCEERVGVAALVGSGYSEGRYVAAGGGDEVCLDVAAGEEGAVVGVREGL